MQKAANDQWTLELNQLDMNGTGEALSRLIVSCRPPFVVAVHGKWGSGKTSMMRYAMARIGGHPLAASLGATKEPTQELQGKLRLQWEALQNKSQEFIEETFAGHQTGAAPIQPKHRILSVWFNAWQHGASDVPLVALLHELREQATFAQRLLSQANKIGQVSAEAGLTLLGDLISSSLQLAGLPSVPLGTLPDRVRRIGEAYEKDRFATPSDAQRFNVVFEAAIDRLLGPDDNNSSQGDDEIPARRLVVFIDDLDRCPEQYILKLLESIKLYLQARNCVFVIGMDAAAVRRAIVRTLDGCTDEHAHEYLEKLVQATVHVPICRDNSKFVTNLVEGSGIPTDAVAPIRRLVEPNPRKLKNFINSAGLAWHEHLSSATGEQARDRLQPFILVQYLRLYHPDIHRVLVYDADRVRDLHEVISEGVVFPRKDATPLHKLFWRVFRHVGAASVTEEDQAVDETLLDEVLRRLDRQRGDRAFIELWRDLCRQLDKESVVARFKPVLRSAESK